VGEPATVPPLIGLQTTATLTIKYSHKQAVCTLDWDAENIKRFMQSCLHTQLQEVSNRVIPFSLLLLM
jgi:hypothetical protein